MYEKCSSEEDEEDTFSDSKRSSKVRRSRPITNHIEKKDGRKKEIQNSEGEEEKSEIDEQKEEESEVEEATGSGSTAPEEGSGEELHQLAGGRQEGSVEEKGSGEMGEGKPALERWAHSKELINLL